MLLICAPSPLVPFILQDLMEWYKAGSLDKLSAQLLDRAKLTRRRHGEPGDLRAQEIAAPLELHSRA